jgi:hypothetical protein
MAVGAAQAFDQGEFEGWGRLRLRLGQKDAAHAEKNERT